MNFVTYCRWTLPAAVAFGCLLFGVSDWLRAQELGSAPTEFVSKASGIKFKLIPAGKFLMGSPLSEADRNSDEVQHEVLIRRPFYLAIHEVTVGQFKTFVDDTGYKTTAERGEGGLGINIQINRTSQSTEFSWRNGGFEQASDHPVFNVSWLDAQKFIAWLSQKDGKTYGLPTEAQWEYACRAGTTTRYWCGDSAEQLLTFANRGSESFPPKFETWKLGAIRDGHVFTAKVGSFEANPFGIYDMHGNVSEWCADWYGDYSQTSVADPQGPTTGAERVCRGGSWADDAWSQRSALRTHNTPDFSSNHLGFRLVIVDNNK